ncbi:MAG: NAD(P)H-dependent oxidoreductase subunit E [Candidatus Cybelea sp.]
MDLHFNSAAPSDAERGAVDALLGARSEQRGADARGRRHLLLPALHAVQERVGWISAGAVNYIGERLMVAPADIYGVATFYALFSTKPRDPTVVHVCDDIACVGAGAEQICAQLEASGITWERSPCLGLCDRAPAALVIAAGESPSATALAPVNAALEPNSATTHVGGSEQRLLRRVGRVDPESLDAYRAHGGYAALARAHELGPEKTIAEIAEAKLLGRGGAAFPAAQKMQAVAAAPARPHYLVCNADESEPGTFKDRVLMEGDPFALIEAMTIAAYAAGCEHAYVYVRGEYPLAARRLEGAIAQARAAGLLGNLEIDLRRGAGAYICGEETALFNSIEGKRGEPRNKPPFPAQAGLFSKPTLINNVETLANLLPILIEGGAAYARTGTAQSTGTRLFSLSGAIARTGVYEVAHGTTLRALIEFAGGVRSGSKLTAILLGGAAGVLLGPQTLDLPLSFEDARAAGATLGSGVVMLFDESADLEAIVLRIARFFREESCGQCVPCRVGTVRQEETLARRDVSLLGEIAGVMRDASICGLGQTASSVVESARANLGLFAERPA